MYVTRLLVVETANAGVYHEIVGWSAISTEAWRSEGTDHSLGRQTFDPNGQGHKE